jgi:hypothetical protein
MNKEQIEDWLFKHNIFRFIIHDDLIVDVDSDVSIYDNNTTELPFQFGKIAGFFSCSYNNLTSLKNFPYYVGGDLYCIQHNVNFNVNFTQKLLEMHIGGDILVSITTEKTKQYKLLTKLRAL